MALADGMTLKFADLPTRNLNVRAETSPSVVGSVRFGLDGQANYRTETSSPYALAGDSGGNYNAWTPPLGTHALTATPYTGASGSGTARNTVDCGFHCGVSAGPALSVRWSRSKAA
jgi:hypothetical protein